MSRNAVLGLQGPFDRAFGFLMQFIDVCPDDVWAAKFGGWPIWQQVYHAVSVGFFLDSAAMPATPFPPEVGGLKESPATPATKDDIRKFATAMKALADTYISKLTDADLGARNAGFSDRVKADMSHAATVAMLAGHCFYHLGSCDAALRERGLKGVF